ncbi:acyl-CoA synthetase [Alicyclobacillus tolerans]|uniref:acyl-CoA synthetase n=1 Tax=Alicyclobacillus tolerans TaxID=90970 RepID=UPI001F2A10E6|nr:acyl-CoA synthetase [Alicyclobacillus tolerans]MCF8563233.1 acyl-CoA synthetase [Alicyclobacillus tolerans]
MGSSLDDLWGQSTRNLKAVSYEGLYEDFHWKLPVSYNIGVDACDRHAQDKGKLALIYDKGNGTHEKWTFWELMRHSNRLANALAGLGCERGDRVAVLLSQGPHVPIAHLAAFKLGAISVPLFTLFGSEALTYRLNDSGSRVLVTDQENYERIMDFRNELNHLEHVIVVDGAVSGAWFWEELLLNAAPDFAAASTTPDDPAIIIYTSGTTGPAKGALHGHRILPGHLPGVSLPHEFAPQQGDLFWTPADWAWIGGLFDVLFPSLHFGTPVVAHRMRKFDPEHAFELIEKWGIQNVFMPPTSLKMMRQVAHPKERWKLQLRTIASGGEPLGDETLQWGENALGLHINEFYGQTECNLVVSNNRSLFSPRHNSMGRAVPGHVVAVIDDKGEPVKPGVVGEIAVKRPDPVMFLRYWNRPEATAAKFTGDWMRTGDTGKMDEEGYFYFVGRADDVISSAGYRIGPAEIEEALVKHPGVLMSAVVGSPDSLRGEVVKAFVQLREGVQASDELAQEIRQWVKSRVGAHEYPREVEFVDAFPMTPSGKIQRNVLKRLEYDKKGTQRP